MSNPVSPAHFPRGEWSEQAIRVLQERYLLKDVDGNIIETPDEMCWRVAKAVAAAELHYGSGDASAGRYVTYSDAFYDMMVAQKFLPNSPTLMNAGTGNGQQLAACFVLPVADSIEGIYDALKWQATIHKSGGGTGFSFSKLRPKGSPVKSTQGVASGPLSFMRVFDASTEHIKQGGKRRGANIGLLRVDHPDIEEFIECKVQGGISNFNISVAITDGFMDALRGAPDGKPEHHITYDYDLIDPHTGNVVGQRDARNVWERIINAAWRSGDPGLFFVDRVNQTPANPCPDLFRIDACNPCGETPLEDFGVCNLGSINLAKFYVRSAFTRRPDDCIDWEGLSATVYFAVRFLDDVIDINPYPLPQIEAAAKRLRRVGLGVMGWADLLFQLQVPYGSDDAMDLAQRLMSFIRQKSHVASQDLAIEREPFPEYANSIYRDGPPMRNAATTVIAPTGTISIIAGVSGGIEPVFALAYEHRVQQPDGSTRTLAFTNQVFEQWVRDRYGIPAGGTRAVSAKGEDLLTFVKEHGRIPHKDETSWIGDVFDWQELEEARAIFQTAHEIPPRRHVSMQAAFQKGTDSAISKTVNLPDTATEADVSAIFLQAWEEGCLGVTIFRDGSKGEQVLHIGAEKSAVPAPTPAVAPEPVYRTRPEIAEGRTYKTNTPFGTAYITVNRGSDGQPLEVFVNIGRAGGDTGAFAEAIGRLCSLALRLPSPVPPEQRVQEIVAQLSGIGGRRSVGFGPERVLSVPDAVAKVLAAEIGQEESPLHANAVPLTAAPTYIPSDICSECHTGALVREEGCIKCYACGFSEC